MTLTRRSLVRGGALTVAALAIAGIMYEALPDPVSRDPQYRFTMLDGEDRAILAAIAPVMLAGALREPSDVASVVRGVDIAIAGLPLSVRREVRTLLGILRFAPSRIVIAGVVPPWRGADTRTISAFLERWRYSGFVQLRSAYDALRQLLLAAWYGNDSAWPEIGYPGPPRIPS